MKKSISLILLVLLFSGIFLIGFGSSDEVLIGSNLNTEVPFSTSSAGISCEATSTLSYWKNDSDPLNIEVTYNSSNSLQTVTNCSKYYSQTDQTCCPTGYMCDIDNSGERVCVPDTIQRCDQITNEGVCGDYGNNDLFRTLIESFTEPEYQICGQQTAWNNGTHNCVNTTSCGCDWDDACNFGFTITTRCEGVPGSSNNNCNWKVISETNKCDEAEGKIIVVYQAIGSSAGTGSCQDKTLEFTCSASVKLPFFSLFNLMLSVLGIAFVYFVFRNKLLP